MGKENGLDEEQEPPSPAYEMIRPHLNLSDEDSTVAQRDDEREMKDIPRQLETQRKRDRFVVDAERMTKDLDGEHITMLEDMIGTHQTSGQPHLHGHGLARQEPRSIHIYKHAHEERENNHIELTDRESCNPGCKPSLDHDLAYETDTKSEKGRKEYGAPNGLQQKSISTIGVEVIL